MEYVITVHTCLIAELVQLKACLTLSCMHYENLIEKFDGIFGVECKINVK